MMDSPTRGMRWTAPGWRSTALVTVGWVLFAALAGGLFPHRARWLLWPHGLSPRGRLGYAVATGALGFAVTEIKHRLLRSREDLIAELRAELGREPTSDEIQRRLETNMGRAALEEKLGRPPTAEELRRVLGAR